MTSFIQSAAPYTEAEDGKDADEIAADGVSVVVVVSSKFFVVFGIEVIVEFVIVVVVVVVVVDVSIFVALFLLLLGGSTIPTR